MNGLILNDPVAVEGMEQDGEGQFIPAKISNGTIDSKSTATLDEFRIIENYIGNLIIKMADSLKSGKTQPNPKICKKNTSCTFCDYFSVCRYEEDNFENIDLSLDEKEVFKKMAESNNKI